MSFTKKIKYVEQMFSTYISAMRAEVHLLLRVLVFVNTAVFSSEALSSNYEIGSLNRSSFPAGFIFGAASAAYQVHGRFQAARKKLMYILDKLV